MLSLEINVYMLHKMTGDMTKHGSYAGTELRLSTDQHILASSTVILLTGSESNRKALVHVEN